MRVKTRNLLQLNGDENGQAVKWLLLKDKRMEYC